MQTSSILRPLVAFLSAAVFLGACSLIDDPVPGADGTGGGDGGHGGHGGDGGDGGSAGASTSDGGSGGGGGQGGGQGGQGGMAIAPRVVFGLINAPDEPFIYAASVHVVIMVNNVIVHDETIGNGAPAPITLPQEFAVDDPPVGASVDALFEIDPGDGVPVSQRLARTQAVAARSVLQRVTITQKTCVPCDPALTCNWGRCLDPFVDPALLEDYSADWADYSWCKPKTPGEPSVVLGTGNASLTPLQDQDVLDVWAGDQGGHHTFLGARTQNLKQTSILSVSAQVPALGASIGPFSAVVVFSDDPSAGYCETYGFLFRFDNQIDMGLLFGETIELTATVQDADGTSTTDANSVVIASDIINP